VINRTKTRSAKGRSLDSSYFLEDQEDICQKPFFDDPHSLPRRMTRMNQSAFQPISRPEDVERRNEVFQSAARRRRRPQSQSQDPFKSTPEGGFQIMNKPVKGGPYKSVIFDLGDEAFDNQYVERDTTKNRMNDSKMSCRNGYNTRDQRFVDSKMALNGMNDPQNGFYNDRGMRPDSMDRETTGYRRAMYSKMQFEENLDERISSRRRTKRDREVGRFREHQIPQQEIFNIKLMGRNDMDYSYAEPRNGTNGFDITYFGDNLDDRPMNGSTHPNNLRTIEIDAAKRRSICMPGMDLRHDSNSSADSLYLEPTINPFEQTSGVNFLPELQQKLRERQER